MTVGVYSAEFKYNIFKNEEVKNKLDVACNNELLG